MGYNLDAIKAKINQLSGANKGGGAKGDRAKVNWWKPQLGQHNIRFLPFTDKNGQPFQEVSYYDSKLLSERRFVVPTQFDMEDPIFQMLTELRKDRSKEAWKIWKNLQPRERYYAPILVRGEEDKGAQIWELNSKLLKEIYSVLAHPDYKDENLMHPENGYDFTVTVSPTDKTFNGNPVKEIKLQPRRKPSVLSENEQEKEKILKGIPNLEAYFKAQVKSPEEMKTMLENFLAGNSEVESEEASPQDVADGGSPAPATGKSTNSAGLEKTSPAAEPAKVKKAKKSIDDAFGDL